MNTDENRPNEVECSCLELQDVCQAIDARGGQVTRMDCQGLSGYRLHVHWPDPRQQTFLGEAMLAGQPTSIAVGNLLKSPPQARSSGAPFKPHERSSNVT